MVYITMYLWPSCSLAEVNEIVKVVRFCPCKGLVLKSQPSFNPSNSAEALKGRCANT
jgi:hypothetical protein